MPDWTEEKVSDLFHAAKMAHARARQLMQEFEAAREAATRRSAPPAAPRRAATPQKPGSGRPPG